MTNLLGSLLLCVYVWVSKSSICKKTHIRATATCGVALYSVLHLILLFNRSIPNNWLMLYYGVRFVASALILCSLVYLALKPKVPSKIYWPILFALTGSMAFATLSVSISQFRVLHYARNAIHSSDSLARLNYVEKASKINFAIPHTIKNFLTYQLSHAKMLNGEYEASLASLSELNDDTEYTVPRLFLSAIDYNELGRYSEALSAIDSALKLGQPSSQLTVLKAVILMRMSRNREAIKMLDQSVILNPDNIEIRRFWGMTLLKTSDRLKDAETDFFKVYAATNDCMALVNKGLAEVRLKDYANAKSDFKAASAHEEEICNAIPWEALIVFYSGNKVQARKMYQDAYRNHQDLPDMLVELNKKEAIPHETFNAFSAFAK